MRSVINLSLPPTMAKEVSREVKKGGYSSTSEFFRELLRDWKTAKLAEKLKKDRLNFKKGKGKTLKSFGHLA